MQRRISVRVFSRKSFQLIRGHPTALAVRCFHPVPVRRDDHDDHFRIRRESLHVGRRAEGSSLEVRARRLHSALHFMPRCTNALFQVLHGRLRRSQARGFVFPLADHRLPYEFRTFKPALRVGGFLCGKLNGLKMFLNYFEFARFHCAVRGVQSATGGLDKNRINANSGAVLIRAVHDVANGNSSHIFALAKMARRNHILANLIENSAWPGPRLEQRSRGHHRGASQRRFLVENMSSVNDLVLQDLIERLNDISGGACKFTGKTRTWSLIAGWAVGTGGHCRQARKYKITNENPPMSVFAVLALQLNPRPFQIHSPRILFRDFSLDFAAEQTSLLRRSARVALFPTLLHTMVKSSISLIICNSDPAIPKREFGNSGIRGHFRRCQHGKKGSIAGKDPVPEPCMKNSFHENKKTLAFEFLTE